MTATKISILNYIEKINSLNVTDFENLTDVCHESTKHVIYNNLYPSAFEKSKKPYIDMHNIIYIRLHKELFGDMSIDEIDSSNIVSIINILSENELLMIDMALLSIKLI